LAISSSNISISACTQSVIENNKNILLNDENNLTQKWEKLFLKVLSEIFWILIFGTYF